MLFTNVTSPVFDPVLVPEKFVADIAPVKIAPFNFAYVDEARSEVKYPAPE